MRKEREGSKLRVSGKEKKIRFERRICYWNVARLERKDGEFMKNLGQ